MSMNGFTKRLVKFLFSYDWEVVEIEGAFFKLAWGIWLLMPWDTFKSVTVYVGLSENVWGWGLFTVGTLHLISVFRGSIFARRWFAFFGSGFWAFNAIAIFLQSHTAALIPLFSIMSLFMLINFYRLGVMQELMRRQKELGPPPGIEERRAAL